MDRLIRFSISGRHGPDTDAPTVVDLLEQVGDYFGVMEEVERALSTDGACEVDWRVVSVTTNSPIEFVVAPYPRVYATNIDGRVDAVVETASRGLNALQQRAGQPPFFTEKAIERAGRLFSRVTNGLSSTSINYDWGGYQTVEITQGNARAGARHVETVLRPPGSRPYKEIGGIEGYVHRVERDGYGRAVLRVRSRVRGQIIKCVLLDQARGQVETHQIAEVWKGRRILLSGVIFYKSLGRPFYIEVSDVRFLRDRCDLPSLQDIEDPTFTGGSRSEDYLALIRDGGLC